MASEGRSADAERCIQESERNKYTLDDLVTKDDEPLIKLKSSEEQVHSLTIECPNKANESLRRILLREVIESMFLSLRGT